MVDLQTECTRAFEEHLTSGAEAALNSGYELGRQALADGRGVLDMAALLHGALLAMCRRARTAEESVEIVGAVQEFLLECLSPFEMAHRGARDANLALRHLNEILEAQTKRIARELHDEAGQVLACVHLALGDLARDLPPGAADRLERVRGLLGDIEGQLRRIAHELRPAILDDLGLVPALEFLAEGVSRRTGMTIAVQGARDGRLPPPVENTLYRIVQEALTNVTKHARAASVTVELLREEGRAVCSIRDDGVGFDPERALARDAARGLGLIGMKERLTPFGGTLRITSSPGRGTEVLVTIPLEVRGGSAKS